MRYQKDGRGQSILRNIKQIIKSWYIYLFQIPYFGEWFAPSFGRLAFATAEGGSFTREDLTLYELSWSKARTFRGMINWYRAIYRSSLGQVIKTLARLQNPYKLFPPACITIPTRILWGEKDLALEASLGRQSAEYCDDGVFISFPQASHWLQHDEPNAVNAHLSTFSR